MGTGAGSENLASYSVLVCSFNEFDHITIFSLKKKKKDS